MFPFGIDDSDMLLYFLVFTKLFNPSTCRKAIVYKPGCHQDLDTVPVMPGHTSSLRDGIKSLNKETLAVSNCLAGDAE